MVKYQSWWRSPPTARKPSETDAKSCRADAALREMALVDLPSGPVETWSEWLRKGSKVTPSMGIDVLDGSEAPPAPAAPSCAASSSRSSTPDALAPQARLDPPRGWRAGLAWAPALGSHCGLRGRLRHRQAARSEPIVPALQVPRPTPPSSARASRLLRLSRALRVAPLSASRPAPAVHACPRQRLGLGRSALVGDVAAAARREPRRRPDGKSIRSCESSPGAGCRAGAVQHGEVALFWTLVRSPRIDLE